MVILQRKTKMLMPQEFQGSDWGTNKRQLQSVKNYFYVQRKLKAENGQKLLFFFFQEGTDYITNIQKTDYTHKLSVMFPQVLADCKFQMNKPINACTLKKKKSIAFNLYMFTLTCDRKAVTIYKNFMQVKQRYNLIYF